MLHHSRMMNQPNDVLLEIFKHLDIKSLCTVERVCKRFHNVSQNDVLWKSHLYAQLGSTNETYQQFQALHEKYLKKGDRRPLKKFRSWKLLLYKYCMLMPSTELWILYYPHHCFWKRAYIAQYDVCQLTEPTISRWIWMWNQIVGITIMLIAFTVFEILRAIPNGIFRLENLDLLFSTIFISVLGLYFWITLNKSSSEKEVTQNHTTEPLLIEEEL